MYNIDKLAEDISDKVIKGTSRRYYRLARGGKWYGGIATADCCGCQLKCVFCWSGKPRDNPDKVGKFYSPEEVFSALHSTAKKNRYRQVRISGNEPTLAKEHLLKVIEFVENAGYRFILETNGLLIDRKYATDLSKFDNLHVRVSIKGCTPDEFSRLTGAGKDYFHLQLAALENLVDAGVSCNPAVMLSFSPDENFNKMRYEIKRINRDLEYDIEGEYIILYPHVKERLNRAGLEPVVVYEP